MSVMENNATIHQCINIKLVEGVDVWITPAITKQTTADLTHYHRQFMQNTIQVIFGLNWQR
jgi:hypothetical protein